MKNRRTITQCIVVLLLAMLATQQAWAAFVGPRNDFRDESIYFVITTRFYDGDPALAPTTVTRVGAAISRA